MHYLMLPVQLLHYYEPFMELLPALILQLFLLRFLFFKLAKKFLAFYVLLCR